MLFSHPGRGTKPTAHGRCVSAVGAQIKGEGRFTAASAVVGALERQSCHRRHGPGWHRSVSLWRSSWLCRTVRQREELHREDISHYRSDEEKKNDIAIKMRKWCCVHGELGSLNKIVAGMEKLIVPRRQGRVA